MSKLVWDKTSERFYETGVNQCVLYVKGSDGKYTNGVAWNGVTAITESPSGAEATALYADNIKYLELMSNEEFGATVEAYTYPDEFAACNGSVEAATGVIIGQQTRKSFGLSYITVKGNADEGNDAGYVVHVVYNAKAAPSEKAYATINDSPEAITFSWELTTTAEDPGVEVDGVKLKPTAHIEIDSTKVKDDAKMKALLDKLHGADAEGSEPTLPTVAEIVAMFEAKEAA